MTRGQQAVLTALQNGPLTATDVATTVYGSDTAAERARHPLRRLEDQGLVRRIPGGRHGASKWELTAAGRTALAQP